MLCSIFVTYSDLKDRTCNVVNAEIATATIIAEYFKINTKITERKSPRADNLTYNHTTPLTYVLSIISTAPNHIVVGETVWCSQKRYFGRLDEHLAMSYLLLIKSHAYTININNICTIAGETRELTQ